MKPTAPALALFIVALLTLIGVMMLPRYAPDRGLFIAAPNVVRTGQPIQVEVTAFTRLRDGEHVAFLQVEKSLNNGQSWEAIAYKSGMARRGDHWFQLEVGSTPQEILIRARAAFRDGAAGDVDQHGQRLDWDGTWESWAQPPAITATVTVR